MDTSQHNLFCPICKSSALSANKQNFNAKNALIGNMAFGSEGLKYGLLGTGKVIITCLGCGYEFKPGEGATVDDFDKKHSLAIQKIEEAKALRRSKRAEAVILILIFIGIAIYIYNR